MSCKQKASELEAKLTYGKGPIPLSQGLALLSLLLALVMLLCYLD